MNPAQELQQAGQSACLGSINRQMLTEGVLKHYIEDLVFAKLGISSRRLLRSTLSERASLVSRP